MVRLISQMKVMEKKTLRIVITNEDGTTDDFIRKITIKKP